MNAEYKTHGCRNMERKTKTRSREIIKRRNSGAALREQHTRSLKGVVDDTK